MAVGPKPTRAQKKTILSNVTANAKAARIAHVSAVKGNLGGKPASKAADTSMATRGAARIGGVSPRAVARAANRGVRQANRVVGKK